MQSALGHISTFAASRSEQGVAQWSVELFAAGLLKWKRANAPQEARTLNSEHDTL